MSALNTGVPEEFKHVQLADMSESSQPVVCGEQPTEPAGAAVPARKTDAALAVPPRQRLRLTAILLYVVLGVALSLAIAEITDSAQSGSRPPPAPQPPPPPALSGGSGGAAASGRYRNLFVEAGLANEAAVQSRVDEAFSQLFFGRKSDEAVFFESSEGTAYVSESESSRKHDVRTEGMSYGMMIAAQRGNASAFEALWRWAQLNMRHSDPRSPYFGYFAWSCTQAGGHIYEGPASDGEVWFAAALYTAAGRFGEPRYASAAEALLADVVFRERAPPVTRLFEVATGVSDAPVQVTFVPEGSAAGYTDPSYHVPAFLELFRRHAPSAETRSFWARALSSSRNLLQRAGQTPSGLAPDKCGFDGTPKFVAGLASPNHAYDGWRVAQNHAMDASWFDADPRHAASCERILQFFARANATAPQPQGYGDVHSVYGEQLSPYHSAGLVAMNAVCALAVRDAALARPFLVELWHAPTPTGAYRYYNGLLHMLALLQLSGGFRYYGPPSPEE